MKIQAFTGRGTMPVEGVEISIDRNFTDGPRNFYRLTTDADGIIDHINLPTPDKNLSQHPESEQTFCHPIMLRRPIPTIINRYLKIRRCLKG